MIPKVPKTVNVAPILIPASTYLVPTSIPLKKVTLGSVTPIVAIPLKTDKKKTVRFSVNVRSRFLFSHLKMSRADEKSILSTFFTKTPLDPSFIVILLL